ncbi:hypothetical protein ACLGI4_02720 [Streptomyces sp. HMX112]|uniref:hypothetical protein n=1 Tax=Streptomyces sp. HMX112 TaxID=3390850 RepID=UPI003A7FD643
MRPESTNGTGGGGLAVPMAWLCAEYVADELLRSGDLVEPGSLEYRAGRRTLALTLYLCDGTARDSAGGARARLEECLTRTAHDRDWHDWVRERLAARRGSATGGGAGGTAHGARPEGTAPDLALAEETWRLLEGTELLAADLGARPPAPVAGIAVDESDRVWLPSWRLGLPLGHLALRLC